MTSLVLNLTKPGEQASKLQLNLNKNEVFTIKLSWDEKSGGSKTDLDLHAIVGINTGAGAKAGAFEDILSTYNVRRRIGGQEVGVLDKKSDGSFEIHGGALVHSPDAQDGLAEGDDEWIRIDPAKLSTPSQGHLEIPLVAMIHAASGARRFADVKNARVTVINSSGRELMSATLSDQFGEFVGVQMGSILIEAGGKASFASVGVGFNGDFNTVLGHFS
ncbi:TerD family protein [Ideonella sp. YS5]|uniref:TerD family protein n=1 Tax=Ideonella sp. YS5 TaxID=3453714 RepID=UPI003EEC2635